jgi:hypothetical protein
MARPGSSAAIFVFVMKTATGIFHDMKTAPVIFDGTTCIFMNVMKTASGIFHDMNLAFTCQINLPFMSLYLLRSYFLAPTASS